ncbi:Response regulator [Burkholderia multivorans]
MEQGRESRRVLVVDEHPIVANAIRHVLAGLDDRVAVTVCHDAGSALEVFHCVPAWFRILLDPDVPDARGFALARQFHDQGVADRCAIVTAADRPSWVADAKRLGMIAYIDKAVPLDAFSAALRAVLDGERVFPATIPRAGIRLTRRQRNILLLLGRGHSTKEIAAMLDLAVGTVDNHIANAMQALTVRNRTHAIFRAIALGLIDASEVIESGCDRGGERSGMCVGAVVSAGVEP